MAVHYCKFTPSPRYGFLPTDEHKQRGALYGKESKKWKMVRPGEVFACSFQPADRDWEKSPPMYAKATKTDYTNYQKRLVQLDKKRAEFEALKAELDAELVKAEGQIEDPKDPKPSFSRKKANKKDPQVIGADPNLMV